MIHLELAVVPHHASLDKTFLNSDQTILNNAQILMDLDVSTFEFNVHFVY